MTEMTDKYEFIAPIERVAGYRQMARKFSDFIYQNELQLTQLLMLAELTDCVRMVGEQQHELLIEIQKLRKQMEPRRTL